MTVTNLRSRLDSPAVQLFLTSAAIMLLELICIRWIAAYIRLFGFFINFALLSALLGIGIGILCAGRPRLPLPNVATLLLALVAATLALQYSFTVPTSDMLFYGANETSNTRESPLALAAIVPFVTALFVPLGWRLGQLLTALPPLRAYGWDIVGSLAGIAVFTGLSFLSTPPVVWMAAFALVWAPLVPKGERRVAALAMLAVLGASTWPGTATSGRPTTASPPASCRTRSAGPSA